MKVETKIFQDDCFKEQEIDLLVAPGVGLHENIFGQIIIRIFDKAELTANSRGELMLKVGEADMDVNHHA